MCRPGKRVGDIGHAVQRHAEGHGYSVVREFVGHGIGTSLHEEPQVPELRPGRPRERLVAGMCLAIEPMVNVGGPEVEVLDDGWTAVTADGSLSAHFELSVAITEHGPWILSEPYPYAEAGAACLSAAGRGTPRGGRRWSRGAAQRALPGGARAARSRGRRWPTWPEASSLLRLRPGDEVVVELLPYDMTRGRIVRRRIEPVHHTKSPWAYGTVAVS